MVANAQPGVAAAVLWGKRAVSLQSVQRPLLISGGTKQASAGYPEHSGLRGEGTGLPGLA